ncbi:hypothetical protein GCM10027425_26480 [Alteromonas gracilis]
MIGVRDWRDEDAPALVRAFADPAMATQGGPFDSESHALAWIEAWRDLATQGRAVAWAVCDDDVPVGGVALTAIERRHDTGWTSYWTSAAARGRGLATLAAATLADHAFRELDLFRLELGHRVENRASCAVATRAGFVAEGVERSKLRYGAERFDTESHARLATDPAPDVTLLPRR